MNRVKLIESYSLLVKTSCLSIHIMLSLTVLREWNGASFTANGVPRIFMYPLSFSITSHSKYSSRNQLQLLLQIVFLPRLIIAIVQRKGAPAYLSSSWLLTCYLTFVFFLIFCEIQIPEKLSQNQYNDILIKSIICYLRKLICVGRIALLSHNRWERNTVDLFTCKLNCSSILILKAYIPAIVFLLPKIIFFKGI